MHLVLHDAAGATHSRHDDTADIAAQLAPLGLQVGQIAVSAPDGGRRPAVADAQALAALHRRFGIRSADRVSRLPGDPLWSSQRGRLRQRHTHSEPEVRVFVRGRGLFDLPLADGGRAQLLVEAGDWLALPPGTPHAFDAGQAPDFDALRLFASAEGWVVTPATDAASAAPPDLDRLLSERRGLQAAAL